MATRKVSFFLFSALLVVPLSVGAAGLVNINSASVAELDALPGIGPAKAQAIVAYRTEQGPFARTEDLVLVKGIGPSTYAGLQDLVTVGVVQPSSPPAGSYTKQTQPAAPTRNVTTNDHALRPAATQEAVAAVAAAPLAESRTLTTSPWVLGFLALVLVAGGVLLVL